MYLLKRLGLLLAAFFCILVAAFGLIRFSIEVGESPMSYVVQDVAVALAGLMGLWACWRRSRQLKARREAEESRVPEFTGQRLEANARALTQGLAIGLLALSSAFCIGWLVTKPGWMAGAVTLLMVTITLVLGATSAALQRGGRPALVMDGHGLDHAWFGRIPWDQVQGIHFKEVQIKHTRVFSLVLGVRHPDRFVAQTHWAVRLIQNKRRGTGALSGVLEIPLNPLDQPPRQIHAAAMALRQRVQPPLVEHWYPGMDDADIALADDASTLMADLERMSPEQALERLQAMAPRMQASSERAQQAARRSQRLVWLLLAGMVLAIVLPVLLWGLRAV